MECPECKASEENLDFWIDAKGFWNWNCFECEHEWKIHHSKMPKDD